HGPSCLSDISRDVRFPGSEFLNAGLVPGAIWNAISHEHHEVTLNAKGRAQLGQLVAAQTCWAVFRIKGQQWPRTTDIRVLTTMLPERSIEQRIEFVVQRKEVADFIPGARLQFIEEFL